MLNSRIQIIYNMTIFPKFGFLLKFLGPAETGIVYSFYMPHLCYTLHNIQGSLRAIVLSKFTYQMLRQKRRFLVVF